VHDKAQITAWFGTPTRVTTSTGGASGCNEMWIYQYGRSTHGGARTTAAALAVLSVYAPLTATALLVDALVAGSAGTAMFRLV